MESVSPSETLINFFQAALPRAQKMIPFSVIDLNASYSTYLYLI
jgi:hypothetical protein